jgi:hypothetical protein
MSMRRCLVTEARGSAFLFARIFGSALVTRSFLPASFALVSPISEES